MTKRYQIFVSSTYADLRQERAKVIQALMEMDCIPAGMELFPAADEEQWAFIRRVIDDCDYYLLIIGGRYGSVTPEGLSYTEKEFDYAQEKGLRVLALLHQNPEEIPLGKSEADPVLRERLAVFRERVSTGRLVKFWQSAEELPGLVALSLAKTIKTHPAVGWVRANTVGSEELLLEINDLRKQNAELEKENKEYARRLAAEPVLPDLADFKSIFRVRGRRKITQLSWKPWEANISWNDIFWAIAPMLLSYPTDLAVQIQLKKAAYQSIPGHVSKPVLELNDDDFQTIKIQLMALRLVEVKYSKTTTGNMGLFWSLTGAGNRLMIQLRTVRK